MPTEEFDKLKRDYIAKHGYTLTIPGIEDVFHFGTEKPMTDREKALWAAKKYNAFDRDRYEEIKYMKKRRKDAYLTMLGSPSPRILNARASIITSVDDAQDALSTLSGIGTLLYMAGTPAIRALVRGPLGWIMGTADALNFVNKMIVPERRMLAVKKTTERATKNNLKSSQTKLSLKHKLEAAKTKDWEMIRLKRTQREMEAFRHGAWKGKVIEGLQTTDNIYGKGISLGAVMNLPYDLGAAVVRGAMGQTVHIKKPDIDVGHWGRVARKLVRNWLAFEGIPEYYRVEEHRSPAAVFEHPAGIQSILSDAEVSQMHMGLFLAHQAVHMTADQIDPLDMDLSLSEIELKAPTPTNPLSLEVIEEAGDRPEDGCAWPATGESWSNARNLIEQSSVNIIDNINSYSRRNAHSVTGWAVSNHATNAALYSLENLAGTGTVEMEHNPSYRATNSLQNLNYCVDQNLTSGQRQIFSEYLQRCDQQNYTPSTRELLDHAERHCGFSFVQMID